MLKKLNKWKAVLFILSGIITGMILFVLGNADDSPGLSFMGIAIAILLIIRGIYYADVIRAGYYVPMIFLIFGSIGVIFPMILFWDGEVQGFLPGILSGCLIEIMMIGIAVIKIIKIRK